MIYITGIVVDAAEILQNVSQHLHDYKSKMGVKNMENRQENEIREYHQWTLQNLRGLQKVSECEQIIFYLVYHKKTSFSSPDLA